MKKPILFFACLSLLLSACTAAIQTPPVNHKTPLYETAGDYQNRTQAEKAAIEMVTLQYGYDPAQILLLKSTKRTWSDSCLEIAPPSEVCVQENIPGYMVVLYSEPSVFEVHTDLTGQIVYALNYLTQTVTAADVAIYLLAKQLALPTSSILIQTMETVDWPDSCLGVYSENVICATMQTPGYLIRLDVQGTVYEFHADIYGSRLIQIK